MSQDWVFLRGLSREAEHWGDFPDLFAKTFDANVHLIDAPGMGVYYQDSSPSSIEDIAAHVLMKIQERNLSRVHIFAYSLGAMVSAHLLQQNPELFDRVVWLNTSFSNLSPWHKRLCIKSMPKLLALMMRFAHLRSRESIIFDVTTQMMHDRNVVDSWIEIQKKRPISFATLINQILAGSTSVLKHVPVQPLLLLGSLQDQLVHPQCMRDVSGFCNAPLYVHPHAGHDVTLDDPEWVVHQVALFLRG